MVRCHLSHQWATTTHVNTHHLTQRPNLSNIDSTCLSFFGVAGGMELGEADDHVFERSNSKQEDGAVGLLTKGLIDRTTVRYITTGSLGMRADPIR